MLIRAKLLQAAVPAPILPTLGSRKRGDSARHPPPTHVLLGMCFHVPFCLSLTKFWIPLN